MTFDYERFLANRERHRRRMDRLHLIQLILVVAIVAIYGWKAFSR
jgi:hypothetical protein